VEVWRREANKYKEKLGQRLADIIRELIGDELNRRRNEMPKQWQLGCINCEKPKYTEQEIREGVDPTIRNVYLLRTNGNRTIVSMCQECFSQSGYDLDKLRMNLYESELECAKSRIKDPVELDKRLQIVEKIKDLEFVGFFKP
jgi:hypothetical protein